MTRKKARASRVAPLAQAFGCLDFEWGFGRGTGTVVCSLTILGIGYDFYDSWGLICKDDLVAYFD